MGFWRGFVLFHQDNGGCARRCVAAALAGLLVAGLAAAQTSGSYRLDEHVFNSGGHPESGTVLTSGSYRMTMDALGESVVGAGMSSASYRVGGGLVSAYPPPGEVRGLRFIDDTTLRWDPEPSVGVYNLYRDWLSELPARGYGQCEQQDMSDEATTDSDTPSPAGEGYFYLVTVEDRLAEEGTKGWDSLHDERPNPDPCP